MEFILLWASFLVIMATDLQRGILIGIVLAVLYFAWSYAQVINTQNLVCAHSPYLAQGACPAQEVCFALNDWQNGM